MLRRALADRSLDHTVRSGGIIEGGEPCPEMLVEVGQMHGIDLTAHRSRQLTPELLEGADLVLCMNRLHVRDVAVLNPSAWPVTFTLLEFIRRITTLPGSIAGLSFDERVARAHEGRTPAEMLAQNRSEDISDPMGLGFDAFVELGKILEVETARVATLL